MDLHLAFLLLDATGVFAALLLALALLKSLPHERSAWLAAWVLLNSAGFVLFQREIFGPWVPEPYRLQLPGGLLLALQVLMNTTPGLFMLLCFRLFADRAQLPRGLLAAFVLQVALEDLLPSLFGITTRPHAGPVMTDDSLPLALVFETLPALLQAGFMVAAIYWTVRDLRTDLVPLRRFLRALALFVIGVGLVAYLVLSRMLLPPEHVAQMYLHEAFVAIALVQNTALLLLLTRADGFALPPLVAQVLEGAPSDIATQDLDEQAFHGAMGAGAWREAGLTIAGLAARLHMPEYRLRRLVNERLGHRNFNAMLHRYRIDAACEALADPAQRDLPILSIALSLGYQSINPFNRAFRELHGTTPSAWRQARLAATHVGVDVAGQLDRRS